LAKQGNLIPVFQELLADIETPVSAYLKVRDNSFSYLLESADGGSRWGRYSFIGFKPFLSVLTKDREVEVRKGDEKEIITDVENPFDVLKEISKEYKPVPNSDLPPFQDGLVGYVNYDLIRKWERLPDIKPIDQELPESIFTAGKNLIVFDHLTHMMKVISFAYVDEECDLKECYTRACHEVDKIIYVVRNPFDALSP